MSEKIDEIAKAIRDECQRHDYLVSVPMTHVLWANLVRAAITAMHDPTSKMIEAAWEKEDGAGVWQSMIDEMLK